MNDLAKANGLVGQLFEDTIDGYFPLFVSLRQMLERMGFASAVVTLQHAPIIHINNLSSDAPVPLNIVEGTSGMIDIMSLCVAPDRVCGTGTWHWAADKTTMASMENGELDAMTRLAEPCYVKGCGFTHGDMPTALLGRLLQHENGTVNIVEALHRKMDKTTSVWGPFQSKQITHAEISSAMHGGFCENTDDSVVGRYITYTGN